MIRIESVVIRLNMNSAAIIIAWPRCYLETGFSSLVSHLWFLMKSRHLLLTQVRNVKPCFSLPGGLCTGLVASFLQLWVTRGREPWTIRWTTTDSQMTGLKTEFPIKEYQKHDGVLRFDFHLFCVSQ